MRLTISILAVLAVVALVSGQSNPDRRARFLELRKRARDGDPEAQRILQASRRKRPAGGRKVNQQAQVEVEAQTAAPAPAPVPARPTFPRAQRVEEEPTRVRTPSSRTRTRTRTRTSNARTPTVSQRTRVPIRQRVTRPKAPTTFRPLTPFPDPTTTQAPTTFVQEITEAPFVPTEILPEEPVFETFAPTEAPRTTQARFQPAPTQARFQPAPTQAPRIVEQPASRVRTNSRGEERVVIDFQPHTALQGGLEIDSRSETFLGNVRHGASTEAPVITNNRYSYFDEDGSYVFGYEATDGSFKEERRALNCIVYGKYGYIDPDGIRREFNYQSGNECDPNAVSDPNLVDEPAPVSNDQFIHQTAEQQLSDAELQELNFNRRRRPQPASESTRRVQPAQRTTRPERPTITRPAPRKEVFVQQFADEAPVTQAPSTNNRFTTPASLNPNKHRFSQNVPVDNFVESRKPKVIETQAPRQQQVFKPVPVRPSPQPQFTQAPVTARPVRPTPSPVSFDFDREFQSLFNHFGPIKGVTPRPAPRIPSPVQTTRVTQPQTFKPQTPTFRPTTRPPPPPQTFQPTTPPPTSRPPPPPTFQPTTQTEGAHQLVFDPSTGGFKTVRTNVQVQAKPPAQPQAFQPVTSKPFVQFAAAPTHPPAFAAAPTHPPRFAAAPTHAPVSRPASPPRAPAPVGVPLFNTPGSSPLPSVPTSGLIIHNRGSSVSTDEFDKFFSQFNLKF